MRDAFGGLTHLHRSLGSQGSTLGYEEAWTRTEPKSKEGS